jgi:hypothetical protein
MYCALQVCECTAILNESFDNCRGCETFIYDERVSRAKREKEKRNKIKDKLSGAYAFIRSTSFHLTRS